VDLIQPYVDYHTYLALAEVKHLKLHVLKPRLFLLSYYETLNFG
jgi:hypothetical protein